MGKFVPVSASPTSILCSMASETLFMRSRGTRQASRHVSMRSIVALFRQFRNTFETVGGHPIRGAFAASFQCPPFSKLIWWSEDQDTSMKKKCEISSSDHFPDDLQVVPPWNVPMSLHERLNFTRTRSERARCVSERVVGEKTWFQPWNMSIEVGSPMQGGFDVFACKAHPSLRRSTLHFGISPFYA